MADSLATLARFDRLARAFIKETTTEDQKKNMDRLMTMSYEVLSITGRLALGFCPDGWVDCPTGGCAPTVDDCP